MKTKQEILHDMFAILAELQSGTANSELAKCLRVELGVYYDILGEDVPEEYWEQIEDAL